MKDLQRLLIPYIHLILRIPLETACPFSFNCKLVLVRITMCNFFQRSLCFNGETQDMRTLSARFVMRRIELKISRTLRMRKDFPPLLFFVNT